MTARPATPTWWELPTAAGRFTLTPVKPHRDLSRIHGWMNDPVVARYWNLDGTRERTARHLARQRALDHSDAYLARLAERPIGYWEVYRAAEDRLAAYYPARPDDLGVHLLIGEPDCRGRGLGSLLLRTFCDSVQHARACRVVAEPDEGNIPSVGAFTAAGFNPAGTVQLPEKRATLMLRESPAPGPR